MRKFEHKKNQEEFYLSPGDKITTKELDKMFQSLMERDWLVRRRDGNYVAINLTKKGWKKKYITTKRAVGRCGPGRKMVELSTHFIKPNLSNGKAHILENTIRHEIAHALDAEVHPLRKLGHDWIWRNICIYTTGCTPDREQTGLDEGTTKYTLQCNSCGQSAGISRRPKYDKACGVCCNKYSGGQYDPKYKMELIQNY